MKKIYYQNEDKRIIPSYFLMVLLSLFTIWQMGVVFFTGKSLSLYGRTPIMVNDTYTFLVIACGYITTILINTFFCRKSIIIGRIVLLFAFLSSILMFIPYTQKFLTVLFYFTAFSCTFMIGTAYVVETNMFENKSEMKYIFFSSAIVFFVIAFLQGEPLINLNFGVYNIISCLLLIMLIIAYFILPSNIEVKVVSYKEAKKMPKFPKSLILCIYFTIFVSTICLVFGNTLAENVNYGVPLFFISGLVFTLLFTYLVFWKKISFFKVYTFSFLLLIIGFILSALSISFPKLSYLAIIIISVGALPANSIGFLSNTLFEFIPIKLWSQLLVLMGFIAAICQFFLLELFRNNLATLFSILSVLSTCILVVYVFIEPNLMNNLNSINKGKKDVLPSTFCGPFDLLSDREKELVNLLLLGFSNIEIAERMYLSENTIRSYRKNIYLKLDIHSKRDLHILFEKNNKKQ